jgi:ubiquitin conjugation factor E4 B
MVSSLIEEDMFGQNSINSVKDLYTTITTDTSNALSPMLKDVCEELASQDNLKFITNKLLLSSFENLDIVSSSGFRSVMTDYSAAINIVLALSRADKRYCKEILEFQYFSLGVQTSTIPFHFKQMHPHMLLQNQALIINNCIQGAAFENRTLFGRIMRIAPNMFDPQIRELFGTVQVSQQVFEGKIKGIQAKVQSTQAFLGEIVTNCLKAGGATKDGTMKWLMASLTMNVEAEKENPSPLIAASPGFLNNLGGVFLHLCRPIMNDIEKLKKVDINFFGSEEFRKLYPADATTLMSNGMMAQAVGLKKSSTNVTEFTFITQSFFMCWRALHIGIVHRLHEFENTFMALNRFHAGLATNEPRSIHYLVQKCTHDSEYFIPDLISDLISFCVSASHVLMSVLGNNSNEIMKSSSEDYEWKVPIEMHTQAQLDLLLNLPEDMIEDIVITLLTIGKTAPIYLKQKSLDQVLSMTIFFLRRSWAVQNPHLRGKLGQLLYQIFLPMRHRERSHGDMMFGLGLSQPTQSDGPHSDLLETHVDGQKYLAPALLLLYGDVEHTGFYEKVPFRRYIMIILKHLWNLSTHRQAFRGIANISRNDNNSSEPTEFISFANGLINGTNELVKETLVSLQKIKEAQDLMKNPAEWSRLSEEERNQLTDKNEENERILKANASLCLETLNMLNFLTSDECIRKPFLMTEILKRFTSMLLFVLNKIVGSNSLQLKIDNMESYNFNPKIMLTEVCQTIIHFTEHEEFVVCMAEDGFFNEGEPLKKALKRVSKSNLLNPTEIELMSTLVDSTLKAKVSSLNMDELVQDAPEKFLDPILDTLMRDPVILPTSGKVVDRSTISQHLLNDQTDPFNRKVLSIDMVIPDVELKKEIDAWLAEKIRA